LDDISDFQLRRQRASDSGGNQHGWLIPLDDGPGSSAGCLTSDAAKRNHCMLEFKKLNTA
jgi:hypothetical protein